MNGYDTAKEIITYLHSRRGVGHTNLVLNGVKNTQNSLLVVASEQDKRLFDRQPVNTVSLSEFEQGRMRGMDKAIVLDNHALTVLLGDLLGTIAALRGEVKEATAENQELKFKLAMVKKIIDMP